MDADVAPVAWKVHPKLGYRYRIVDRRVVYEHREVLLDALGLGHHPCHHCGELVSWQRANNLTAGSWDGILVVDHLNHDRGDNRLTNLVPSCQRCNLRRKIAFVKARQREARVTTAAEVAAPPAHDSVR